MMFWFLSDSVRLAHERKCIEELASTNLWIENVIWKITERGLELWAELLVGDKVFPIRMSYPALFPLTPPSVFPREAETRWSSHQYLSGELCLEWGPDNWQSQITGADILKSAYKLLTLEILPDSSENNKIIPTRHLETLGQRIRRDVLRFYYDSDSANILDNSVENSVLKIEIVEIVHRSESNEFCAFIKTIFINNDSSWLNPYLPNGIVQQYTNNYSLFVKVAKDFSKTQFKTLDEIELAIGQSFSKENIDSNRFILLQDSNRNLYLYCVIAESGKLLRYATYNIVLDQDNKRLGPEFEILKSKSVAIIGLGSVGSKIAISLARSGLKRFFLLDEDVFFPENLCRNELNWQNIGQHKVSAIKEHLEMIKPDMDIKLLRIKLSGQEASSSVSTAIKHLEKYDLIIDATANPKTFNLIGHTCNIIGKPLVWLEVFAGGIGGLICRYRNGVDPNPIEMRNQITIAINKLNVPTAESNSDYTTIDHTGKQIVASDADVTFIMASAVQISLDILLERDPSLYPYSVYLLGLRNEWIFKQPFEVIPVDIENIDSPSHTPEPDQEVNKQNLLFLKKIIENSSREDKNTK